MPIGIPKVPFCICSGDENSGDENIYIKVHERLQMDRILFLYRDIEEDYINRLIGLLLYLDLQNDEDITLYINCEGGEAQEAIALYDTIGFLLSDVCTLATGLAASEASLILAAGKIPKRVAFPNACISISQPVTDYVLGGSAKKIQVEAKEMFELRNTFAEIYAKKTGQPIDVVQNDLERDTFMSAKEAQDYGIIDRIVKITRRKEEEYYPDDFGFVDHIVKTTRKISEFF